MSRPLPVERVPPGETAAIDAMIREIASQLTRRFVEKNRQVLRDAHPKHHGLVSARFVVDERCPSDLRYGIFRRPQSFNAYIRYSNSQPTPNHDLESDIRGCAIKLEGAPRSLLGTNEHDFILTTGEAFFGIDAVDFESFPRASESGLKTFFYFLRPHRLRGGMRFLMGLESPAVPWNVEYFSQTPYRLGPHCVKYHVRPITPRRSAGDPWYLRPGIRQVIGRVVRLPLIRRFSRSFPGFNALADSLAADLRDHDVELEFLVQRWSDLATMPVSAIEDATRRWSGRYEKVATIHIPRQDTRAGHAIAERMAFNPWQVSRMHQPLGSINRARGAIYQAISRFRNAHNPPVNEPRRAQR